MSLCITKSNKFKHLESKLRRISYLSIKLRKFGTLKNTAIIYYVSNLRQKDNLQGIPKIGISNPKRYDKHPYHFTI